MASKESLANKTHWEVLAKGFSKGPPTPDVMEWFDLDWAKLSAEPDAVDYAAVDATGVEAMWITPRLAVQDRVIFYSHGGGFIAGSISTHRKMVGHLATAVGCRALLFDYAYSHEQKFPAQIDTTVKAYRWLLNQGIKPEHVALAADSCGAILTFGLLQRGREQKFPLPAAAMIISGWFDLTVTAKSYETNREKDPFFRGEAVEGLVMNLIGPEGDRRDANVSPLYADLKGFPPLYLQPGADEGLVDESRMFAQRAEAAGVQVRLDVVPEQLHSFQMMAGRAAEADEALMRFAAWVRPILGLSRHVRKAV